MSYKPFRSTLQSPQTCPLYRDNHNLLRNNLHKNVHMRLDVLPISQFFFYSMA